MATAKAVMDTAAAYIGTTESPRNSNNVIFNTHYYGREVYDGLWSCTFPWCCTFVWDVFRMSGAAELFNGGEKTASCTSVMAWAKANGLTVNFADAQYGDLVIFDWSKDGGADHIGLIEKKNGNGTYTTIEGNTADGNDSNGGEVMRRKRYASQILCVIRPNYEQEEKSVRYATYADIPEWAKPTIKKLINNGYLTGKSGSGENAVIDLSADMVRILVVLDRSGVFG